MPTKRIGDPPGRKVCLHPEHNPPTMVVWEPGIYEHTCPGCGRKVQFVVPQRPTMCEFQRIVYDDRGRGFVATMGGNNGGY